jgi:DNA-binding Lrp family transcriptional regulator
MIEVRISNSYDIREFERALEGMPGGVEITMTYEDEQGCICAMTDSLAWLHRFLDQFAAAPAPSRRTAKVTFVGGKD